ncbi:MAG: isochorismatase family protein [Bacteroidales bacterium]|nr:isochorismatase family protein [Bacteroidales bacterium]MDY3290210.1 isochorismatase family protein [Sodaliphilus sp.]MCI6747540.1 isochorismatase family protein [Bacteroidales bacterium]MCI7471862.1 isochorismatase family protein [Bacteroidales bacterium]MDY4910295.1 isochorismatase family protein [Sodaliphilus sp.]
MSDRKMLIVVDPQIDFISGSLPVPGAAEAMNQLADYVKANGDDYALMVVTNDWHPYDHCSFAPNGGPWPVHCVQNSEGAATYWPLLEALYQSETETLFLQKGDLRHREEYSIVQNTGAREFFENTLDNSLLADADCQYQHVDVCGIAGDVCVLNTLRDLLPIVGADRLRVLTRFAPSLDGGKALQAFIDENGIVTL